ncbi:probable inactive shikimate kinase like 2, chloroplastic [Eucalyptus grandis]|uniref:probable inactive shikimate kinase like 2, chloroplastic n=1 Tax=Eucalyptus grandis TaxID=71139 RepID=UPI00192EDA25|nr:probable inactive shikimate kinase like 2, chloroplastic [Eucalyptus grandis]
MDISGPRYIHVDANDTSLTIQLKHSGSLMTLMETDSLFDRIKSAETIWYTPLETKELLETFAKQTIDSSIDEVEFSMPPIHAEDGIRNSSPGVLAQGYDAIAEAQDVLLESLSSHVRAVVATLGGQQGAARRADKWQHLYAGFTVWLSTTEATDEDSAKKEARRHIEDGSLGYANADVVVKLEGWDADYSKTVAQASLRALKRLVLSDRKLPDKKSLHIRFGMPWRLAQHQAPGWDSLTADDSITSPDTL